MDRSHACHLRFSLVAGSVAALSAALCSSAQPTRPTCGPKLKKTAVQVFDARGIEPEKVMDWVKSEMGEGSVQIEWLPRIPELNVSLSIAWKTARRHAAKLGCDVAIMLDTESVKTGRYAFYNQLLGAYQSFDTRATYLYVAMGKKKTEKSME